MTKLKSILIAAVVGLFLGLAVTGTVFAARYYTVSRIPLNTNVAGLDLSGMAITEAQNVLEKEVEDYLQTEVALSLNEKEAMLSLSQLGLKISAEENIQAVKSAQTGSLLPTVRFFLNKNTPDLLVTLDEEKFQQVLNENFQINELTPVNAHFYMNGQRLMMASDAPGQLPNIEELSSEIVTASQSLKKPNLNLTLSDESPQITLADIEPQEEELRQQILHNFTLTDPIYTDDWKVSLATNPQWVSFEPNFETKQFTVKINPETFNQYVDEEISKWLDKPQNAMVAKLADQQPEKATDPEAVITGMIHDGRKILRDQLIQEMEEAIVSRTEAIVIPTETLPPDIQISPELQAMGIKDVLSVGHTSYYGSPANRVHNIRTALDRYNGQLIAPGETFSFNETLGPVNAATGYRRELVIKGDETIPEYGGGVCQVSTTMYRSILLGGLPVDERNQHSYAVSYYSQILGHGLDATIYLGGPDLRFTNDTGNHILVQTYMDGDYELYFAFLGTKDGRSAELEGPFLSNYHSAGGAQEVQTTELAPGQRKQVAPAHTGFTAVWYRHLTTPDGEKIKEEINTRYRAVPAKVLVGSNENE